MVLQHLVVSEIVRLVFDASHAMHWNADFVNYNSVLINADVT